MILVEKINNSSDVFSGQGGYCRILPATLREKVFHLDWRLIF
jgi:hypothetical protein